MSGGDHRAAYGLATDFDPFHRIEADTVAIADAADGHLTASVPSCPGWSMADLAWHVLEVQHFWGAVVAGRVQDPAAVAAPERPDESRLVPRLRTGVGRLVESLREAAPDEPVYTWASRRDAGFVVRHQVQEAAVHRWDAERALGRDVPIDAAAATDAVEEFLQVSTPFRVEDAAPVAGRLLLEAADSGLRWIVGEAEDGAAWWRRLVGGVQGEAATVVRASASDLLLFLYRRRRSEDLEVTGDVGVADRFALRTSTE